MKYSRILGRIFADWPAKILSLAAALLLTLFFSLTRLEQRTISIPLAVSMNEEMAPSSQYPRMVRVLLRGDREVIYGIRDDEVSASLDLSTFKSDGVFRVPIRLTRRGNALTADPLEIRAEPAEIAIGLEKRTVKRVPVTPSFKGFLETGYELSSYELNPQEISISGPAGLVARTSEVSTDTIELGGKKGDFSMEVRLINKDTLLSLENRASIVFSARVRKSFDVKDFADVAIGVRGLSPGLRLQDALPKGSMRMHIPEDALREFNPNAVMSIDMSALTRAGSYTLPVMIEQPLGSVVESFEPQTVTVRVQE